MTTPVWLPDMIFFKDYQGDWNRYLEALYSIFVADFVTTKPVYRGVRLGMKRYPMSQGKEATFWHMTSTGDTEEDRLTDFRRCERIRWPKPIIEHSTEQEIKVWREPRSGEQRIHLWFEAESYLVVLAERRDFILPWTAYPVFQHHQKAKLNKRWEKYKT